MEARLLWQVHAGVLDHHDSLWDTRPGKRGHAVRQRGMSEWLAEMISLAASREPPRRLLFIGLSFGAALAQLTGTGRVAPVHTAAVITAPVYTAAPAARPITPRASHCPIALRPLPTQPPPPPHHPNPHPTHHPTGGSVPRGAPPPGVTPPPTRARLRLPALGGQPDARALHAPLRPARPQPRHRRHRTCSAALASALAAVDAAPRLVGGDT